MKTGVFKANQNDDGSDFATFIQINGYRLRQTFGVIDKSAADEDFNNSQFIQ